VRPNEQVEFKVGTASTFSSWDYGPAEQYSI
jgi:hypothetical protein